MALRHADSTSVQPDEPPPYLVTPVFNDWAALHILLPLIDDALAAASIRVRVLILDDGSTLAPPSGFAHGPFRAIEQVEVLELRRNLGHQRALAIGLAYIEQHVTTPTIAVMDGDGEDAPADLPRLLARYEAEERRCIVFAERRKRAESLTFRFFYLLYRYTHWIMTGMHVRVGNFSVLPRHLLYRLVVVSELWNHYAAAVVKARLPYVMVPTARSTRLSGRSSMNYVSLVTHGLSAISVYGETVGVRLLAASAALIACSAFGICLVVAVRLFTDLAIPGWATVTTGILLLVLLQAAMFSVIYSFTVLGSRHGLHFVPARDYRHFIGRIVTAYPHVA